MLIAIGALWGYQQYFAPNQQVKKQLTNQFGADYFTSFNTEEAGSGSGAESGPTVKDNAKNNNANTRRNGSR
ncbi:hypothetical protein [Desulfosporosinus acidiphilus]|uniref:hypothetical protein n=1 Tax=Desulfosporosinus acidiphilus TaxID=885581 RepID=UPI0002E84112|nr:hypothetical protein [Desulfosporosinus acidiphilus]